jgi:hypothetical protein
MECKRDQKGPFLRYLLGVEPEYQLPGQGHHVVTSSLQKVLDHPIVVGSAEFQHFTTSTELFLTRIKHPKHCLGRSTK